MVKNEKAKDQILNALRDLFLVERRTTDLSPKQKEDLEKSIRALEDEFLRLSGLDPNQKTKTYSDIAGNLNRASKELARIKNERVKLANTLITASKLLGSLRMVLLLI